jgi:CBS domain containing-hemolysin-like protein
MVSLPWPGPLALVAAAPSAAFALHGLTGKDWGLLVALLFVLAVAGLASASETAFTSVNRIRIRNLAEDGDAPAQRIERLLRDPNSLLSTILVVNNVAVIVASTMSTLIALDVFTNFGEIISTVLLSLVVLIFCEITPKTAAVQSPERWARALVWLVYPTTVVLHPLIAGLTTVTNWLVRLFGGRTVRTGPFVTEEELRLLVEVGEEEGVLEEEEKEMIHNVFELGDTTAREVMVPRIDMVTIEADERAEEAVSLIVQGGQSRIPVYSESIDNIIGVLYAKDLLRVMAGDQHPPTVRSLVRRAYFVPETKRLDDLLHEMQLERVHMAIVNDEYGQVAGLVTIEDVVEEIIGDIQDEYDREEVVYEKLSDDEYIINPKISIDDFNDLLDTTLTSEDYDTLGGYVYSQLDKIPSVGDVVQADGLTITVLGTKGRRVTRVKVVRGKSGGGAPAGDASGQPDVAPPGSSDPPTQAQAEDAAGEGHPRHPTEAQAQAAHTPTAPSVEAQSTPPDGLPRTPTAEDAGAAQTPPPAASTEPHPNRLPTARPSQQNSPIARGHDQSASRATIRGARTRYTMSRSPHSRGSPPSRHR